MTVVVNSFLSSKDWNTVDINVSWRSMKILCGFVSRVSICITYVIGVQITNEKRNEFPITLLCKIMIDYSVTLWF